jgi:LSD1 subclass zinc finger protein
MGNEQKSGFVDGEIICKQCGAKLTFKPGSNSLNCQFCGAINEIEVKQAVIEEIDYLSFIANKATSSNTIEVLTIKCETCGAQTTFAENVVAQTCDFCDSPLVAKRGETSKIIEPESMLPFKITDKVGQDLFKKWLKKIWFAPNNLKKYAYQKEKLHGMYLPYWTYDSSTTTDYTGQRGDDYQVEEDYTNDKGERSTRTVTKTRWSHTNGTVYNTFDDVLVVASKSLPQKHLYNLEPWDLKALTPYDPKYIAGFKAESYGIDVQEGFEKAKDIMQDEIDSSIRSDIGGDRQQIESKDTDYQDITFKHILLPIWLSAYRYNNKVYRFMINGQTGEVQGERPYSWIKITLAVLVAIAAITLAVIYLK